MEEKDFKDMIRGAWLQGKVHNGDDWEVWQRLRRLKQPIKDWLKNSVYEDAGRIQRLEEEIQELEVSRRKNAENEVLRKDIKVLKGELWKLYRAEELAWQQKYRLKWNQAGDRNTKFFHMVGSARRRINVIRSLAIQNRLVDDQKVLRGEIENFFEEHFNRNTALKARNMAGEFKKVSTGSSEWLQRPFTEAEVFEVIECCDGNKASGPDGFNINFFKKFWKDIKREVMKCFDAFYRYGSFDPKINSFFISLIPKCENPTTLHDYRPICLVGSIYKILAKVLAKRLSSVMEEVIGAS